MNCYSNKLHSVLSGYARSFLLKNNYKSVEKFFKECIFIIITVESYFSENEWVWWGQILWRTVVRCYVGVDIYLMWLNVIYRLEQLWIEQQIQIYGLPVDAGSFSSSIPAQTRHPTPIRQIETPTIWTILYLTPSTRQESAKATGIATQSNSWNAYVWFVICWKL